MFLIQFTSTISFGFLSFSRLKFLSRFYPNLIERSSRGANCSIVKRGKKQYMLMFFFFFCTGTDHLEKIISLTLCSSREYFSSILQQYSRGKRQIVTKLISVRIIQSWKRERKNFRLRWQCLFPLSQNSKNNFLIQYPYNHYFTKSRTINKISLIT